LEPQAYTLTGYPTPSINNRFQVTAAPPGLRVDALCRKNNRSRLGIEPPALTSGSTVTTVKAMSSVVDAFKQFSNITFSDQSAPGLVDNDRGNELEHDRLTATCQQAQSYDTFCTQT